MQANKYELALASLPGIGHTKAKILATAFGSAEKIFYTPPKILAATEGIGKKLARMIAGSNELLASAEKDRQWLEKSGIHSFFLTHEAYPSRLKHCYDPPTVLYKKGNADLNAGRTVCIVGTRSPTSYGRSLVEALIPALKPFNITVISGLAYGIDALVHHQCLRHGIPTIGVMASGVDYIYPPEHTKMAHAMLEQGALVSEFKPGILPEKHFFPSRNRIVAGMADAAIVIETAIKGGSMITAELASGYHRDVFAFPGRTSDSQSAGCNFLISKHTAQMICSATDLIEAMNWDGVNTRKASLQTSIFPALDPTEAQVWNSLETTPLHIDALCLATGIPPGKMAALLLQMEMKAIIEPMPGKIYKRMGL